MAEFPASHKVTGLPTCGMRTRGRRTQLRRAFPRKCFVKQCTSRLRGNASAPTSLPPGRRQRVHCPKPALHGIYLVQPLVCFALLSGQSRVESYEPRGACLVEFGYGLS
jgi:hypothetical protein